MCLALLAVDCHRDYRLIIAANRDEYHARATEPARFWAGNPELLAGRDAVAGGTWLGVTRGGRIALIANVHAPHRPPMDDAPSRGQLPLDFLRGTTTAADYARAVADRADNFTGFSLMVGDRTGLQYLSNRDAKSPRPVAPGLHGLGNRTLDSSEPKLTSARTDFGHVLQGAGDGDEMEKALFALLAEPQPRGFDGRTPEHPWREPLSALFVRAPGYGTRSTTLVMIGHDGAMRFAERRFDDRSGIIGTTREQWLLR